MAICKVTMCDVQPIYRTRHHTMNNVGIWLSADMQARIEPPPITLIKLEVDDDRTTNIIKVKMRRNPSPPTSETYSINMNTFEYGQTK